jgi:hypothetical protein
MDDEIVIGIEKLVHNNTNYQVAQTSADRWVATVKDWDVGLFVNMIAPSRDSAIQLAHRFIDTPESEEENESI